MSSPDSIDPYAPPSTDPVEAVVEKSENTIYITENGYSDGMQLVANTKFESPPFCPKMGIPTDNLPEPICITRKMRPLGISLDLINIMMIILAYILIINTDHIEGNYFYVVGFIILTYLIFRKLLTKPIILNLPFSDLYKKRRKRRIYTLNITLALTLAGVSSFLVLDIFHIFRDAIVFINLTIIVVLCFLISRTRRFVVAKNNGEYYYLLGVHQDYLAQLPSLPSGTQPRQIKGYPTL